MEFKAYLSQKYQGYDSFIKNIIYPIFGEDRYVTAYNIEMLEPDSDLVKLAESTGISSFIYCGIIELEDNPVYLFDITVKDKVMMERNRVSVQKLVKRVMDTYSGAFMLIHYENSEKWDWRFTFCQLKDRGEYTDSKRYTFLLGPNQACTTAAQNFGKLASKGGDIEIGDIVKAFDVEALSNEFFGKYKAHYEAFVEYITGKRYEGKEEKTVHDPHPFFASLFGGSDKAVRDYVKLLLGRITFLHFLQKKGWLGVPENGVWGSGDEQFMLNQFEKAGRELKDDFVVEVLNPLFFDALDCDRTATNDVFDSKVFGRIRVPYLNGGMFEKTEKDAVPVSWPAEYFGRLFKFFSEYNFTIDENDPNEAQVGVDPEMLGKIFENLLEDNKDKGAFYTPKTIVKYMCQESLIAYLVAKTGFDEKKLRDFVHSPEEGKAAFDGDQQYAILDAILKVKICDPAIGSGAFPIGLLNELVWCKEAIYGDQKGRAEIKREIIRDNIYGVDIEKGAVDIARLRFWLSLVVDEEEPSPLPNLDYKIMQGNSLLEWYNGVDLSHLVSIGETDLFLSGATDLKEELARKLKAYFDESNHTRKKALKDDIARIIKSILEGAGVSLPEDIDISENDQFFLWHTWFNEVFSGGGGFDIVIGNPPYISIQGMPESMRRLYKTLFSFFFHRYDLFGCFIERGIHLLANNGLLTFIQPSVFLNSKSFKFCREYIVKNTRLLFLDLLKDGVFDSAVVPTMIMSLRRDWRRDNIIRCSQEGLGVCYSIRQAAFEKTEGNVFNLNLDDKVASFIAKTEENCVFLGEIARISRAINVGDYSKYLFRGEELDTTTFNKTIPVLKGSSIHKWVFIPETYRLIPSFNEFVSAGDLDTLKTEKLMMKRIGKFPEACYDNSGIAGLDTIYTIRITDSRFSAKYVLGLLNSKLIGRIFRLRVPLKGNVFPEFRIFDLNQQVPIYVAAYQLQAPIIALVDKILAAKKADQHADTSAWEAEIDRLVYDLYGVPQEDRK